MICLELYHPDLGSGARKVWHPMRKRIIQLARQLPGIEIRSSGVLAFRFEDPALALAAALGRLARIADLRYRVSERYYSHRGEWRSNEGARSIARKLAEEYVHI
jgi:hypothetical protein